MLLWLALPFCVDGLQFFYIFGLVFCHTTQTTGTNTHTHTHTHTHTLSRSQTWSVTSLRPGRRPVASYHLLSS